MAHPLHLSSRQKTKEDLFLEVDEFIRITREYALLQRKSPDVARKRLKEAYKEAQRQKTPQAIALYYCLCGSYKQVQSYYREALQYFYSAYRIFLRAGAQRHAAYILHSVAVVYSFEGNHHIMNKILTRNLSYFSEIGDRRYIAKTAGQLAIVYALKKDQESALRYFHQSISVATEIGDHEQLAVAYCNIGMLYAFMGDFPKAKEYYLQSLEQHRKNNDPTGEALLLSKLGTLCSDTGEYDNAEEYLSHALRLCRRLGSKGMALVDVLYNLGWLYYRRQQMDKAILYYTKALNESRKTQSGTLMTRAHICLGIAYFSMGNYEQAITYMHEALQGCDKHNMIYSYEDIYKVLYNSYESLGDMENAYRYHKLYTWHSNEIHSYTKVSTFIRQEMTLLTQEQTKEQEEENRLLRHKLEHKSKELTAITLELLQRSEFLASVEKQIKEAVRSNKRSKTAILFHLMSQISRSQRQKQDINGLIIQVEESHQEFLHALARCFPDLSGAEMKICSLLRLNMSSKEISQKLLLSERTVESHRHNIRKKLQLPAHTSISTFLSAL